MQGDSIIVEPHHRKAAADILPIILPEIAAKPGKYTLTVAGESGSGKSETATAIAEALAEHGVTSFIFQQDDYFVYPPKSNDQARRKDIAWVGLQEVKLDLLDQHLQAFLDNVDRLEKPLVIYEQDSVSSETVSLEGARVAIAEGTYTTMLENADRHVFIDRDYLQTRAHREKRSRHKSELDPFIDRVLGIEHDIISAQKSRADIVVDQDYAAART